MIAASMAVAGLKDVEAAFARHRREFLAEQRKKVRQAGGLVRNEVRRRVGSTLRPGTGRYRRAVSLRTRMLSQSHEAQVYIRKYAFYAVHELGVTIRPKRLGQVALARRVARGVRGLSATGRSKMVFQVGGNVGRFRGAGRAYRLRSGGMWVSVTSVTIPARPVWGPAFEASRERAADVVGDSFLVFQGSGR